MSRGHARLALALALSLATACDEREGTPPSTRSEAAEQGPSPRETCRGVLEQIWDARAEEREILEPLARPSDRRSRDEYLVEGEELLGVCREALSEEERRCLLGAEDPLAADCGLDENERTSLRRLAPVLVTDLVYARGAPPGRAPERARHLSEEESRQRLALLEGTWRNSQTGAEWSVKRSGAVTIEDPRVTGLKGPATLDLHRTYAFDLVLPSGPDATVTHPVDFFPSTDDVFYAVRGGSRAVFQRVRSRSELRLEYLHGARRPVPAGEVDEEPREPLPVGMPLEQLFVIEYREPTCRVLDLAGRSYQASCRYEREGEEEVFRVTFTPPRAEAPVTATYGVIDELVFLSPDTRDTGRFERQH